MRDIRFGPQMLQTGPLFLHELSRGCLDSFFWSLSACLDEESIEWYHPIFITHDPKLVGSTEDHLFGFHDS